MPNTFYNTAFCDNAACPEGLHEVTQYEPAPGKVYMVKTHLQPAVTPFNADVPIPQTPFEETVFYQYEWNVDNQRQFFCNTCTKNLAITLRGHDEQEQR